LVSLAPDGLDPLRQEVTRLEKLRQASESDVVSQSGRTQLPAEAAQLERLAGQLRKVIEENEAKIDALNLEVEGLEREIEGRTQAGPTVSNKSAKAEKSKVAAPGLRRQEAAAKDQFTTLNATAEVHRISLTRLPTAEQLARATQDAE